MPNFSYKAIDNKGEEESGFIISNTIEEAKEELKNRKLIPLKINEAKKYFKFNFFSKISSSKLSLICRQLSVLVLSLIHI